MKNRNTYFAAAVLMSSAAALPAYAQESSQCLRYVQSPQYESCRVVVRDDGEARCLCRFETGIADPLVTGAIPSGGVRALRSDGAADVELQSTPNIDGAANVGEPTVGGDATISGVADDGSADVGLVGVGPVDTGTVGTGSVDTGTVGTGTVGGGAVGTGPVDTGTVGGANGNPGNTAAVGKAGEEPGSKGGFTAENGDEGQSN